MQPDRSFSRPAATSFDAGLRDFFRGIYNNLALGLTLTGVTAWMVAASPALMQLFFGNQLMALLVIFSPLLIMMFGLSPRRVAVMSSGQASFFFYLISALIGISFATIFFIYSHASIARVFFITAGTFAGASAVGYSTRRDLTGMGGLMMMGMWGIVLACIVNLFMHSPTVYFVTSVIGVVVSVGLIAWNTQAFKEMYAAGADRQANDKLAVMAALSLYINFINLFQFLIQLMGDRR